MIYAEDKRRRAQSVILANFLFAVLLGIALIPLLGFPLHLLLHGLPAQHFHRECGQAQRMAACRPGLSFAWIEAVGNYYASLPRHWPLWRVVLEDSLWPDWPRFPALLAFLLPMPLPILVWRKRRRDLRLQGDGSAYFAERNEIAQAGLFHRYGMVLGRMKRGPLLRSRYLRNRECLSGLLVAPPGTGKTLTLMTNLISDWPDTRQMPSPSIFVNDPKGEIYSATAGWRSRHGLVFRLAWGEMTGDSWNPLDPSSFRNGHQRAPLRRKLLDLLGSLFGRDRAPLALTRLFDLIRDDPDWRNRIADDPGLLLPTPQLPACDIDDADYFFHATEVEAIRRIHERIRSVEIPVAPLVAAAEALATIYADAEKAIDAICAILIPETIEPHWRVTGREALAGFIGFIIARAEARPDHAGRCHFGALLDWLTTIEQRTSNQPDQDLSAHLLDEALDEARRLGYSRRVQSDLGALRLKPDRERGSVISTAAGAIAIFKNAAARTKTSSSSFRTDFARGIRDPKTGRVRPVTIYCVVNIAEAETYGKITGLLVESLSQLLLSEDDAAFTAAKRAGSARPVLFLLDEFWTLPPLNALRRIPALGRSMWCSALVVGQSYAQIASKYGADGKNALLELKASSSYQLFFTQNDFETAREISDILGQVTVMTESSSHQTGWGQGVNPFATNRSEQTKGRSLMRPEEIMRLQKLTPARRQWGEMILRFSDINIFCRPCCPLNDPRLRRRLNLPIKPQTQAASSGFPMRATTLLLPR